MKNEKTTVEWDYNIPDDLKKIEGTQIDWNQTLMTMINQIAAKRINYYSRKGMGTPHAKLKIPNKFKDLIKTFGIYYNETANIYNNRFQVEFINTKDNHIDLDGFKVKIINFKVTDNNMKKDNTQKIIVEVDGDKLVEKAFSVNGKDMTAVTSKGSGLRFNQGKLRYDLVEPRAHRDMVKVLTYGATKYFDRNWENGLSWTSVIASAKRHLAAIEAGEDYDYDPNCEGCKNGNCKNHSGELHVANLACNAHFLNAFYYTFPQGDDRPKKFLKLPKIGLDVDGVIADFTTAWNELYPEIPAEPTSWYLDRRIGERFDQMRKDGTLDDFYLNIKPLILPEDLPFEPHCYITSRPVAKEITEQWLDALHFPAKKVYSIDVRQSKVDAAKDAGVTIFVDDSFDNFVDLNNNGIFTYLFSQKYNSKHDVGHMRIKSLKDIPVLK